MYFVITISSFLLFLFSASKALKNKDDDLFILLAGFSLGVFISFLFVVIW